MEPFEKFLSKLAKEAMKSIESRKKVVKTLKIRKSWQKALDEMVAADKALFEISKQVIELKRKSNSKNILFWAMVEDETGMYDEEMRFNKETNLIEVTEDSDGKEEK